jgi:hypothetical protein
MPDPDGEGPGNEALPAKEQKEARARLKARRLPPTRDPKLYDYE